MSTVNHAALRAVLALRDGLARTEAVVRGWKGTEGGRPPLAYVEYTDIVHRFVESVQANGVIDRAYQPNVVGAQLRDPAFLERASLAEIRAVLTWVVRGERFAEGHIGECVRDGTVERALARLGVLLDLDSSG